MQKCNEARRSQNAAAMEALEDENGSGLEPEDNEDFRAKGIRGNTQVKISGIMKHSDKQLSITLPKQF